MSLRTEKKQRKPKRHGLWLQIAITVAVTLAFVILAAFFAGRTIAQRGNEELRLDFYTRLSESPLRGLIKYIFNEDSIPSTAPILPGCVNSTPDGISPAPSASEKDVLLLKGDGDGYLAHVLAIKDPSSLFMGRSTFNQNYVSEIMHLQNASYAFSAADSMKLNVIDPDSEAYKDADGTFFGLTDRGILAFGGIKQLSEDAGKLTFAQEAEIHTLVHTSLPTSFEPSRHAIGAQTLSIGQCADGSLLIVLADGNASVDDLTKLFYRYSAVNAAIVYVGEAAGILCPDGSVLSFGSDFEDAQYSHAWLIK